MTTETGYQGNLTPYTGFAEFNAMTFLVQQLLANVNTATLVKVVSCTNSGGVSPVGFVDVQPLVNQLDGSEKSIPHGVIRNIPYFRIQGGANAVIIDPEAGDIGIAVFASKDISSVKATKGQANPGSGRRFNMADGLFLGGVLNGSPTQYVQFTNSGITIKSPTKVMIDAPDVVAQCATAEVNATTSTTITSPSTKITGTLEVDGIVTMLASLSVAGVATVGALASTGTGGASSISGDMSVTGDITASGTSLHTHTHGGVTTGTGNTGAPN